jgi:hypothetical protein
MPESNESSRALRYWSIGIVLAALWYVIANIAIGGITPGPAVFIVVQDAIFAGLIALELRWARNVFTGLSVLQAVNLLFADDTYPHAGAGGPPMWLIMLVRASYIAGVAFCLWGVYRQSAIALVATRDPLDTRSRLLRRAGWFAVATASLASLVVSFALAMWSIARLERQHGVRADFGTNGLNWLAAGVGLVGMLFPLYLLVAFFVIVPYLAKHSPGQRFKTGYVLAGLLLPGLGLAVLSAASSGVVDRIAGFVWFGPPIVTTAGAAYWYLGQWESQALNPLEVSASSTGAEHRDVE